MTVDEMIKIVPSKRQLAVMDMEFYAFIHYGMNTYTGKEVWGGDTPAAAFNPTELDARQWVEAAKGAGMKGLILTCRHHSGFCLWPTKYSEYSIKNTSYKNGNGDIVAETAAACKEGGIKFGIYLGTWDRNHPDYGNSEKYNNYMVNQLKELLTSYGDVFCVWFDGARGDGEKERAMVYDFERYYATIRSYAPNACISVCGPDIRWCGNEAGSVRKSEWSVVPDRLRRSAAHIEGDKSDLVGLRELSNMTEDIGSRAALFTEKELCWYPCEVDTSIRPSWFYVEEDDEKLKTLDELYALYLRTVGQNSLLLLNVPVMPSGRVCELDARRLAELGGKISEAFKNNLAAFACFEADNTDGSFYAENCKKDGYEAYYKGKDSVETAEITIDFPSEVFAGYVVLKENILLSERIERFEIYAETPNGEKLLFCGTNVGRKRIAAFERVKTKRLKIKICESRSCPTLSFIGVY